MRLLLIFYICFISSVGISQASEETEIVAIKQILNKQVGDWNRGDIDAFMKGYWKSEKLSFVGKNGVTKGWQQTLDNYKKNYDTREKMGQLRFEIIEVEILGEAHGTVLGKFFLSNPEGVVFSNGIFTLLWKKINGQWLIIRDQTCQ